LPFNSELKYGAALSVLTEETTKKEIYVSGTPETILELSVLGLDKEEKEKKITLKEKKETKKEPKKKEPKKEELSVLDATETLRQRCRNRQVEAINIGLLNNLLKGCFFI